MIHSNMCKVPQSGAKREVLVGGGGGGQVVKRALQSPGRGRGFLLLGKVPKSLVCCHGGIKKKNLALHTIKQKASLAL